MKVEHLPDDLLNAFVGYILYKKDYFGGRPIQIYRSHKDQFVTRIGSDRFVMYWIPSTFWEQCGPLIDHFDIFLERSDIIHSKINGIIVKQNKVIQCVGNTRMRVACKVIVKSVFGDEVDIDFNFDGLKLTQQKQIDYKENNNDQS